MFELHKEFLTLSLLMFGVIKNGLILTSSGRVQWLQWLEEPG